MTTNEDKEYRECPPRLLPVRVMRDTEQDAGKYEPRHYVVRNDGEPLTRFIPKYWAKFLAYQINRPFAEKTATRRHGEILRIATLRIDGNPIEESKAPIVSEEIGGLVLGESPEYAESFEKAAEQGDALFLDCIVSLPIDYPVIICAEFHVTGRMRYTLPLCESWLLDLLLRLEIVKMKTSNIVAAMDGSKIVHTERGKPPHTIVTIWRICEDE